MICFLNISYTLITFFYFILFLCRINYQQNFNQFNIMKSQNHSHVFQGIRKHFFKNVYYNIKITDTAIIMSIVKIYLNNFDIFYQDEKFENPKYNIPLSLTTKIGFCRNTKKSFLALECFTFPYKGKRKEIYANSDDLIKMMKMINNKVVFLEIYQFYEPCHIIGKGSSARVMLVKDLFSNKNYAVKSIDKKYLNMDNNGMQILETEIKILRELTSIDNHSYFITLNTIYESDTSFYLVLDYMKGKSLTEELEKIKQRQLESILSLKDTKVIMKRLLEGVSQMHKHNIIHRDIKPDNILLSKSGSYDTLVISDFGLATFSTVGQYLFAKCGTPGYVAPEILKLKDKNQKYSCACDVFSCGVLFFKLLTGKALFEDKDVNSIMKKNKECKINFQEEMFQKIPKHAMSLLVQMLQKDPNDRISAEFALKHKFFQDSWVQVTNLQQNFGRKQKMCRQWTSMRGQMRR